MSYVDDLILHEILDDDSSSQASSEDIWWNSPNNNNNNNNNNTLCNTSSSATTLDDRSSINSLPWAEDAIKHNQDEWERIQSIFFGEQPIEATINDKRLANEFNEWMNKFPHLRIIGKSCPIYYINNKNALEHDECSKNEEIFAIHPISSTASKDADHFWNDNNKRLKHPINTNKHGILYSKDYNNEFFIRESSSAFHRNNNNNNHLNTSYKNETKLNNNNNHNQITTGGRSLLLPSSARPIILHYPKNDYLQYSLSPSSSSVIKSAYNSNQITSSLNENYLLKVPLHITSIIPQKNNNTMHQSPSTSFTSINNNNNNNYLKIPSIYTDSNNLQQQQKTIIDKRKQLKNSITLPSINVNALPIPYSSGPSSSFSSSSIVQFGKELFENEIITGRAISALYQRNTNNNTNNYNHQKTDLLLPINMLNYRRPSTITKSRNKSE